MLQIKLIIMLKNLLGSKGGLLSLISEKTGKISFKRSAGIVVLTTIVAPDVASNGLTPLNVVLCVGVLVSVALPTLLKKDK
jgi:hypothetical protein